MTASYPKIGGSSPWGEIDDIEQFGFNACSVSTAGHGGFWVSPDHLKLIPREFRTTSYSPGPWFEEDCDWCIPYVFCELGPLDHKDRTASALDCLLRYYPEAHRAAVYGKSARLRAFEVERRWRVAVRTGDPDCLRDRMFDGCFESNDGDEVARLLVQRIEAGPELAQLLRQWPACEHLPPSVRAAVNGLPAMEPVMLADGLAAQAMVPGVPAVPAVQRDLARLEADRDARRGHGSLPAGGLFDEVAKAQQVML